MEITKETTVTTKEKLSVKISKNQLTVFLAKGNEAEDAKKLIEAAIEILNLEEKQ